MIQRSHLLAAALLGGCFACTPPTPESTAPPKKDASAPSAPKSEASKPKGAAPEPTGAPRTSGGSGMGAAAGGGGFETQGGRVSNYAGIGAIVLGPAAAAKRAQEKGPSEPEARAVTEADLEPAEQVVVAPADAPRLKRAVIDVSEPEPDGSRRVKVTSELIDAHGNRYEEAREGVVTDGTDGMRHFRWLASPETKRVSN
jgi:hypothetical protein